MTLAHILEELPTAEFSGRRSNDDHAIEKFNLEEFERGYQAGWDDSAKAYQDNTAHFTNELREQLMDLSFTYHEAKTEILSGLTPLLEQISTLLLPEMARVGFAEYLKSHIQSIAEKSASPSVTITVHPDQASSLEPLFSQELGIPFDIYGDTGTPENVARLRFKNQEMDIDLSECIAGIQDSIAALCSTTSEKVNHG